ncbi:hypothetical protein [Polyangium sp. y55x31]|uniref:hypothetical protein n=1 Tax=Polyangium sp. y55x31 TaxID=3042688 RepID=UPI002482BF0D|nr:hypothetical protein [Polyangium sp. y55x31]MDI1479013.1 hypothetical protein [Polyangium sp. y55x31]
MEQRTRPRGRTDTNEPATPLGRIRAAAPRAFVVTLTIALLLHVPLLPTRLFAWLSLLFGEEMSMVDMEGEVVIPIDLDLVPGETAAPAPAPEPEPAAAEADPAAEPIKKVEPKPKKKAEPADAGPDAEAPDAGSDAEAEDAGVSDAGPEDAGVPDAAPLVTDGGTEVPDAGAPIAELPDAGADAEAVAKAEPDAGPDAAAPVPVAELPDAGADAGGPKLKDPLAAAGSPAEIASKNPNVQVLIAGDRIRKHELGTWFSRILVGIPQWQSFFKDTPIDPIRDLDHLLIAGPQFRDSRKVVAVMDFNVPEPKIRAAIETIVKRSDPPGRWLEDAPVPAAIAKADKGERIFALVPGKRILVVLPADAKGELAKVKSTKGFNKSSGVGIALSIVTPHRAFKGLPFEIPDTFKWMRLSVTPTDDGGADVLLEAQDKDAALAQKHAGELGPIVEGFRKVEIPFLGRFEVLGPTPFVAEGDLVRATTHVTNKQLKYIMSAVEQQLAKQAKAAEEAGKKAP